MTDRLALTVGAIVELLRGIVGATSDQSLPKDANQEANGTSIFDSHDEHGASLLALCLAVGSMLCCTSGLLDPRFGMAVDPKQTRLRMNVLV
jgi:hypothetical protein